MANKNDAPLFAAPTWANLRANSRNANAGRVSRCRRRPLPIRGVPRIQRIWGRHVSMSTSAGVGVQVAAWLNAEYPDDVLRTAHTDVGRLAERHCASIVGERDGAADIDMGEVLVQLGSRLEKERWDTELFVGPWEVANKVSELLMKDLLNGGGGDGDIHGREEEKWDGALSFDMGDAFDRYSFIRRLLDAQVSDGEMGHVLARVAGFTYKNNEWDSSGVESKFLRDNLDTSSKRIDVWGTAGIMEWFIVSLGIDEENDPNGRKIDQLNTYISTLHGAQITGIQKKGGDARFRRLEIVAMWLHLYGEF